MCLAVPLKIAELNGFDAVGVRDGIRRSIRVDFIPEPKIGDYVMVHAGFAIERLSEEQALEDIAAAEEVEKALAEVYQAAREMEAEAEARRAAREAGQAAAEVGAAGQQTAPETEAAAERAKAAVARPVQGGAL